MTLLHWLAVQVDGIDAGRCCKVHESLGFDKPGDIDKPADAKAGMLSFYTRGRNRVNGLKRDKRKVRTTATARSP